MARDVIASGRLGKDLLTAALSGLSKFKSSEVSGPLMLAILEVRVRGGGGDARGARPPRLPPPNAHRTHKLTHTLTRAHARTPSPPPPLAARL